MGILDDAIKEHLELKRRHGASDEEVARQEAEALGPARREPGGSQRLDEPEAAEAASSPPPDPGAAVGMDDGAPPPPDPGAAVGLGEGAPPPPVPEDIEPLHAEPSALDPLEPPAAAAPADEGPDDPFGPATEAMPAAELPDDPFGQPASRGRSALDDVDDELAEPEAFEPEVVDDVLPPDEAAATAEADDPLAPLDDDATRVRPLPPIDDEALPPEPALPGRGGEREDDEPPLDDEPTAVRPPARDQPPGDPDAGDDVLEETPDFLQDTPEHDRLWFEQRPPRDFDFDD